MPFTWQLAENFIKNDWVAQPFRTGRTIIVSVTSTGITCRTISDTATAFIQNKANIETALRQYLYQAGGAEYRGILWMGSVFQIYDMTISEGKSLSGMPFPLRHRLIPKSFINPHVNVVMPRQGRAGVEAILRSPTSKGILFTSSLALGWHSRNSTVLLQPDKKLA